MAWTEWGKGYAFGQQHFALRQTVAPAAEPLTTAEAKAHLRVDISDDDTLIDALVIRAREWAEEFTGRAFINQTWTWKLDRFPHEFRVPRARLVSVTSIKYVDPQGAEQTLAADQYTVDTFSEPGRIEEAYGTTWPATRGVNNAVEVVFVAGYGAAGSALPESLRQAMLLLVGEWYEYRLPVGDRSMPPIPHAVESLLAPHVVRL